MKWKNHFLVKSSNRLEWPLLVIPKRIFELEILGKADDVDYLWLLRTYLPIDTLKLFRVWHWPTNFWPLCATMKQPFIVKSSLFVARTTTSRDASQKDVVLTLPPSLPCFNQRQNSHLFQIKLLNSLQVYLDWTNLQPFACRNQAYINLVNMYKLKMCLHDFNQSINHSPARSHNHKIYLVPISDMSLVLSLRFKCSVFIWQTMASH